MKYSDVLSQCLIAYGRKKLNKEHRKLILTVYSQNSARLDVKLKFRIFKPKLYTVSVK